MKVPVGPSAMGVLAPVMRSEVCVVFVMPR
jgi:hypothetical protein